MHYETLNWQVKENVGILTLNRPGKLNSFTLTMFAELKDVLRKAKDDETVRALVIKGSGKSFSAGGDMELLKYLQGLEGGNPLEKALADLLELGEMLYNLEKPTIVAVRGYCLGVGLSLALLGDIRLASEDAVFGAEFVAMGIIPDVGLMYTLPRLVGPARAKELVLSCRRIKAEEGERIGLVNSIVPHEQLDDAAFQMASRMGELPALAIKTAKKGLNLAQNSSLKEMLQYEIGSQALCLKTEDHKEAVTAFLEKRKPVFKGK